MTFDNDINQGLQINIGCFLVQINERRSYRKRWDLGRSARVPDMTSTWYTTNDATFEVTGIQLEVGSQCDLI